MFYIINDKHLIEIAKLNAVIKKYPSIAYFRNIIFFQFNTVPVQ